MIFKDLNKRINYIFNKSKRVSKKRKQRWSDEYYMRLAYLGGEIYRRYIELNWEDILRNFFIGVYKLKREKREAILTQEKVKALNEVRRVRKVALDVRRSLYTNSGRCPF